MKASVVALLGTVYFMFLVLLITVIKAFGSFRKNELRRLHSDQGESSTQLLHGIILFVMWCVLSYLQLINSRYLKHHYIMWVVSHVTLGSLILIFTLVGVFLMEIEGVKGFIAVIVIILLLTLATTGIWDLAQKCSPNGSIGQVHVKVQISGWVAQVFGFLGCLIGMFLIDAGVALTVGLVVLSLFWGGVIIFMEVGYRRNLGFKPPKPSAQIRETFSLKTIRDPSKQLAVIDNKVISLKNFAKYHPGGYFLIEKNFGTDMSRYFYGVYGHNQHFKAHNHALYNWNWMEKRVVGIITENIDMQELMFTSVPESEKWSIVERKPITSLITRVSFGSKGIVSRPLMILDPNTWGKHFKYEVTTPFGKRTRFYTFSFALGKNVLEMHEGMAKAYNSQQEYESELNASDKCETIDAFPKLYYYQKAVSQFLINIDISSSYNELKVSAPMGVGLGINKGDNGSYVAITAGTGIVPMMDLVCYLFRKNVTEAANRNNIRIKGFKDEEFDLLGHNFRLQLWASFVKRDEVVGLDLLQTLAEISEKEGFNNFTLKLRISGEGAPRWDSNFIQMNFNPNVDGVFIRGPQEFNWKMEDNLVRVGYDVKKILHI